MSINNTPNAIVYTENMLTADSVQALAASGFTTVIVGLFHVHDDGTLWYNDDAADDTYASLIASLKTQPGSHITRVMISIGGGNWYGHPASVSDTDYPAMKATWSQPAQGQSLTSQQMILDFMKKAGVDGLDLDYEPVTTPFDADFIVEIATDISAQGFFMTAAPYTDDSDWMSVLTQSKTSSGNLFTWWNLQLYGGASYSSWYAELSAISASTGISNDDLAKFLIPGYSLDCGGTPYNLQELKTKYPALNGAFIWNYDSIVSCAPQQAENILSIVT